MSDEHEHHMHPMIVQFGPSPEQVAQARAQGQASGHEMIDFLESLTEDQMRWFKTLMQQAHDTEGESALYYIGFTTHMMHKNFNICASCGVNHDKELRDMVGNPPEMQPEKTAVLPVDDTLNLGEVKKGTDDYNFLMDQYGMEQDDDGSDHVMCKNCGKWYDDLADRMLKPPGKEGCDGCIEKEKWG